MNIVIVRTDYPKKKKKNNPNKATMIQFESKPRDLSGLISIKMIRSRLLYPPSLLLHSPMPEREEGVALFVLFFGRLPLGFYDFSLFFRLPM